MRQHLIIITFLACQGPLAAKAQNTLTQKLTGRYWGINKQQLVKQLENDTSLLQLKLLPNKKASLAWPYHGGFLFCDDGSFTEIKLRSCDQDRKGCTGRWTLSNETLRVKTDFGETWCFRILALTDSLLTTKQWVEEGK